MGENGTTVNGVPMYSLGGWTTTSSSGTPTETKQRTLTPKEIAYLKSLGYYGIYTSGPIADAVLKNMPTDFDPTKVEITTRPRVVSIPKQGQSTQAQAPQKEDEGMSTLAALGLGVLAIGAAWFTGGASLALLTTAGLGTLAMTSCSQNEAFDDFEHKHEMEHHMDVNLEKRDVPVKTVEVVKEVPVEVIKEVIKEVEKIVEVPVPYEVIVEVEKIVKEYVYVEVPVEVIKEVIKEVIVEKIVEKEVIKEVPVEVIVEVEKIVEKIVEVEKIVTETKEVYIDPEYEGEPEPVLDEINEILDPDNKNRDGVTTLMNFTKDYEQQAISATLDARYCSDKQQVYAVKTRDFEDPENIKTYASHMGITKTTYNGKPAIICQVTPSFNNTNNIDEMSFNYYGQKLLMFVPDKENGLVKRYKGTVDEKGNITWVDDGEIKRDSKGRIQDSHNLAEYDGKTYSPWTQKLTNFGMNNDNIFMSDLFPDEFEEAKKEEEENEETQEAA